VRGAISLLLQAIGLARLGVASQNRTLAKVREPPTALPLLRLLRRYLRERAGMLQHALTY